MNFVNFFKNVTIKFLALVIVLFLYMTFFFFKILVPGIVIAYITKISLVLSVIIFLLFVIVFLILRNALSQRNVQKEDAISIEEYIE